MRTLVDEIMEKEPLYSTNPFNFYNLDAIWKKYQSLLPSGHNACVEVCHFMVDKISGELISCPSLNKYKVAKKFKNDILVIKRPEGGDAARRFKQGKHDVLGDTIQVFNGPNGLGYELFRLKPGMLIYTAEWTQWLRDENDNKIKDRLGKDIERWSQRHMRMYIGNNQFRDKGYHRYHGGGPVYGEGNQMVYVVLAVYDPFYKCR